VSLVFQTTVKEAMRVPGLDYVHVVGTGSSGKAQAGDYLTDGEITYEVISIPFVRGANVMPVDEVDICIRPGEYKPSDLVGKILCKVR